jgi:uncharacterized protein YjbI with pentapeptide repeats
MRSACRREAPYQMLDGEWFCVLHCPGEEKVTAFQEALERKLKARDFDFGGVWFPREADFSGLVLPAASFREARFRFHARFNKATFVGYANFRGAEFTDVDFSNAEFMEVDFKEANFGRAFFLNTRFSGNAHFNPARFSTRADFAGAEFQGRAHFGKARLWGAYFANAKFASAANFGAVEFAAPNFSKTQFSASTYFGRATFSGEPNFQKTIFDEIDFSKAAFNAGAVFEEARFQGKANFSFARLSGGTFFNKADFVREADFSNTDFFNRQSRMVPDVARTRLQQGNRGELKATTESPKEVIDFFNTTFKDKVVFESSTFDSDVMVGFARVTFEQPNRVTFDDVVLRPMWFVGVDCRGLRFAKVTWAELGSRKLIASELRGLKQRQIARPYESLEIACRQLAVNAEENNRYDEAMRFRLVANVTRRRQSWHKLIARPREWKSWSNLNPLLWIYGFLSGYGERAWQAASVLAGICVLFAILYYVGQRDGGWWERSQAETAAGTPQSPQPPPRLKDFRESLIYSAGVVTLQKPEPLPSNRRAKLLVLFETVLGPIQAALLALAIRRRFMR